MKKLTITATVKGKSTEDLVIALEEIIRLIREGFRSGADRNEDGSYSFESE